MNKNVCVALIKPNKTQKMMYNVKGAVAHKPLSADWQDVWLFAAHCAHTQIGQ